MQKIIKIAGFILALGTLFLGAGNVLATSEEVTTNLIVTKVVCTTEDALPNWGNGGPDITSTTATDWVSSHPGCYLASDFNFEWAFDPKANPGDNVFTGGEGWTTFGPTVNTGIASTTIPGKKLFWVREKFNPSYLAFSGALQGEDDLNSDESKYSAEIYCKNDVLNYDNFDYVDAPTDSGDVHCVAFNFEIDACPNLEGEQSFVPFNMHKINGSCVPSTSTVNICKIDNNQNSLPGWSVILKGDSVQSGLVIPTNLSSGINSDPLMGGVSYIAKSMGTWLNQGGANAVDTEYSTTDSWVTKMDGYTGYQTDILELQINNLFDPASNWGAYNSLHQYIQSFVPSIDGPANFRIFDGTGVAQNEGWFGDNSGNLTVDISKGYAGITGQDGCITFTNVPYGNYTVDEIMQDGWENVSGLQNVVVDSEIETFTIVNKTIEPVIDQCPNIEGDQVTIPLGKHKTENGDCVLTEIPQICTEKTMTVVSDGTEQVDSGTATILNFIHSGWGSISGSNWIWNVLGVNNPLVDEEATFTKKFMIPGLPVSAVLNVLADNSYSGSLNTFTSIGSPDENNFATPDTYNITDTDLINGENTISLKVKNWALAGSNPQSNPAGLNYKIDIIYKECAPAPEPENTPPTVVLNGSSSITLTVGDAYVEQGATGADAEDDTAPVPVITGGPVVTNAPGSFILTYTVTDTDGATASVTRTVIIKQAAEPEPETPPQVNNTPTNTGGGTVPLSFLTAIVPPAPTQGRVLGATTTCGIYLEKFLRRGYKNDPEQVKKVQQFLNDYFKLNIPVTGFFGPQTDAAVKKFQLEFAGDILKPWNLKAPTGIVYITTTTKINKIMCPELDIQAPNLIPFEKNPNSPAL